MKVTNISQLKIYLSDLKLAQASPGSGRRGEDQYVHPGDSIYLPNTSEVLRSVIHGEIAKYVQTGQLKIEDQVSLDAAGGANPSVVLTHNFKFPPAVYVLKQVGSTWVDATGTVDVVHNSTFTTVTVSNTTAFPLVFLIRLL